MHYGEDRQGSPLISFFLDPKAYSCNLHLQSQSTCLVLREYSLLQICSALRWPSKSVFLLSNISISLSRDPTFRSLLPRHSRCPQPALLPTRRHLPTLHDASRPPTSKQPLSAQQHHLTPPQPQPTTRALTCSHYHAGPVRRLSSPTSASRHGQRREQTRLLATITVSPIGVPPLRALAMNRKSWLPP
jgi:hypothetical protein